MCLTPREWESVVLCVVQEPGCPAINNEQYWVTYMWPCRQPLHHCPNPTGWCPQMAYPPILSFVPHTSIILKIKPLNANCHPLSSTLALVPRWQIVTYQPHATWASSSFCFYLWGGFIRPDAQNCSQWETHHACSVGEWRVGIHTKILQSFYGFLFSSEPFDSISTIRDQIFLRFPAISLYNLGIKCHKSSGLLSNYVGGVK